MEVEVKQEKKEEPKKKEDKKAKQEPKVRNAKICSYGEGNVVLLSYASYTPR